MVGAINLHRGLSPPSRWSCRAYSDRPGALRRRALLRTGLATPHRIRLKQRPPSRAIPRPTIRPSRGRVVRRSTHPGRWPRRLVCPLVGSHRCRLSVGSPDHVSALSRPGTRPGIRPVIHDHQQEGADLLIGFPAAFRPPALASWSSCARSGTGPSSRLAYRPRDRTRTGLPCFARTSCDRGGCPLYSGDSGAHPERSRSPASARRISAARPCTPPQPPSMRGSA